MSKVHSWLTVVRAPERFSGHSPFYSAIEYSPTLPFIVSSDPRHFTRTKPGLMRMGSLYRRITHRPVLSQYVPQCSEISTLILRALQLLNCLEMHGGDRCTPLHVRDRHSCDTALPDIG